MLHPGDPRDMALEVVCAALRGQKSLQDVLDRTLKKIPDPRDKSLVTELSYGYLRYRGRMDFAVAWFLSAPRKLPFKLKTMMGLAAYELFFLDRVPSYATISRTVDLGKHRFGSKMGSLINAVLRQVTSVDVQDPGFFQRDHPSDLDFCSRFYSCPKWIVKTWFKDYGREQAIRYLEQSLKKPPLGLRLAPGAGDPDLDNSLFLERRGPSLCLSQEHPEVSRWEEQGLAFRQSFAGQKALWETGMTTWPSPVWDACAGRGGKALLMESQGLKIWASDYHLPRLQGLVQQIREQGRDISVFAARGEEPPLQAAPGTVLLDVPCTGLGVLSRRPDIKWKRTPKEMNLMLGTQKALLDAAARILPGGGELIYMTCTLSRAENETQMEHFLSRHKDFELIQTYLTDPAENLGEFFFAARMRRKRMDDR